MENSHQRTDVSVNSSSVVHTILPPTQVQTRVYFCRFYILFVFVGLALMQSMTWNTWGPIADTAITVYGWNQGDIALLSNWGPIAYIPTAFFFSWLLEEKGLRIATLLTAVLLLIGVLLRCIPVPPEYTLWVMHPGQLFIGLAGPVMMGAPPALSAVWFPMHQRTTATAIGAMSGILGVSASFIVGPQLVHDVPKNNSTNVTTLPPDIATYEYEMTNQHDYEDGYHIELRQYEEQQWEIRRFMYIEAGVTAFFCLCAFLYFPAKPPLPPSTSASLPREDFWYGFKQLCRRPRVLAPAFSYGIAVGTFGGFETELTLVLNDTVNVSQDVAGWIGFYCNIAGFVGGLIFGGVVDLLGGRTMKAVLLMLLIGAVGSAVWLVLITMKYIAFKLVHCYISIISLGFLLQSMIPLFFEICAEGAYPIGEGTTTMFSTFLNNFFCLLFLLVAFFKSLGTLWMTWALLGSIVIVMPLLLFYKEHYNRIDLDTNKTAEQERSSD